MAQRRILVTDDEALFRASAAESLRVRFQGAEVLEAEDGEAAIAILERTPIDVLITDLQMPKLGGLELIAHLTSHRTPVQVVVVSAHMNEKTRGALDELGALACIDKPIDLDTLHEAVERMLAVPRAHVSGVTLSGFLQLLEMEKQTCALRVSSPDGTGTLVFDRGQLVDAWTGELVGDDAALAILGFRECTLDALGVLRATKARIVLPLSFLLLEAARRADEESSPHVPGQWESLSVGQPGEPIDTAQPEVLGPTLSLRPSVSKAPPPRILQAALCLEGSLGAALVDYAKQRVLWTLGDVRDFDLAEAALGNANVYRDERELLDRIAPHESVEELLISLTEQIHMLRPLPAEGENCLLFLVVDRRSSNLALVRTQLSRLEAFCAGQPKHEACPAQ